FFLELVQLRRNAQHVGFDLLNLLVEAPHLLLVVLLSPAVNTDQAKHEGKCNDNALTYLHRSSVNKENRVLTILPQAVRLCNSGSIHLKFVFSLGCPRRPSRIQSTWLERVKYLVDKKFKVELGTSQSGSEEKGGNGTQEAQEAQEK